MGKHDVGTPKWISNRIKSKGLQKLRWYCQMCQKQCRDENGFKCHTSSESHQRQLLLFAENPDSYLDAFSKDFESGYLEVLRRRFGTKRVHANVVYQEYIAYKEHVHMNSTTWETLTDFVKYLGRVNKCSVDETEKGWFVTYIDRNPEALARQEALNKKEKMIKDDQERMADFIEKQVARAKQQMSADPVSAEYTELRRDSENAIIQLALGISDDKKSSSAMSTTIGKKAPLLGNALATKSKPSSDASSSKSPANVSSDQKRKRKLNSLEQIRQQEEMSKEKLSRRDYWLTEGIVVKVVTKDLGSSYFRQKAVVRKVEDKYVGVVKMLDGGSKLRLDQSRLETVVPAVGRLVRVLNGAYRGHVATLDQIHPDQFCATLTIAEGPLQGRTLTHVAYEDFSKLFVPT